MQIREKYHLEFGKTTSNTGRIEFDCWVVDGMFYDIAKKINQMHLAECEYLIEQIESAQAGKEFYNYIPLDHEDFTDDDGLEIFPPDVIINRKTKIPLEDMKLLMHEWIDFVRINSAYERKNKK